MDEKPRLSIREMADNAAASIVEMEAQRDRAPTQKDRSDFNKRIRMMRELEEWYRTRNGYE
jgi:hypothetical protein